MYAVLLKTATLTSHLQKQTNKKNKTKDKRIKDTQI